PSVGVIGCGYWGRNLVRNHFELGSLRAICDVDRARVEEMGAQYGVTTTTEYEELLSMREIQGVVIAAPAAQHYVLAKAALRMGKDVFVEKPLALEVGEGEELEKLARERNRILMVGHLLRYHPAVAELGRLIHSGELGRVEYVSSSRLNLGKLRTEEDILWSFAPHDLSVILYLLNEAPTHASAQGVSYLNHELADITLSVLTFASGVKAHVFVS